jgi:hypothetical protein
VFFWGVVEVLKKNFNSQVCTRVWKMSEGFCGECGSSLEGCEEVDESSSVVAEQSVVSPRLQADKKKGDDKEKLKREKMQKGEESIENMLFFVFDPLSADLENIFSSLDKSRIREVLVKHNFQLEKSTDELLAIQREADRQLREEEEARRLRELEDKTPTRAKAHFEYEATDPTSLPSAKMT